MDRDGAPRVERRTAASLLSNNTRDATWPEPLIRLLAAATAPARPHELAGEEAAVAALRQSVAAPVRATGRRATIARLLTVKVAAAFAATALGGAAVAAASGALPELTGTSGIGTRPTTPAPAVQPTHQNTHGSGIASSPSAGASAASPSVESLCRTFIGDLRAEAATNKQKELDKPAFAPLVAAAGGRNKVERYCVRLLRESGAGDAATPGASPAPQPKVTRPDKSTKKTPHETNSHTPRKATAAHPRHTPWTADREPLPPLGSRSAPTFSPSVEHR